MSLTFRLLAKCPECKRMFAMKKLEKKLVRTEAINMVEALYQPHLKGEIDITAERFVPGVREAWEIAYVCRFCGAKHTKFVYKNIKK